MSQYIYELEMKVRDYECDLQGIVNNANYQHYLEHTRHEFLTSVGVSFAALHEQGVDPVVARINMSFNFTSQLTNWLEITFRTKYNRNESDIPNTYDYMGSSPYHEVYRAFPFIPVYLPDGNFAAVAGSNFNYNIAGIMAQAGRDITSSDDFWYTGAFNITPIKGLSIKGDYTGNKFFKQQKKGGLCQAKRSAKPSNSSN